MDVLDNFINNPMKVAIAALNNGAGITVRSDEKDSERRVRSMWMAGEDRRKGARSLRSMYDNDWEDQLKALMRKRFRPENYERLMLSADASQNPLRWIVRKLAGPYKKKPTRSLSPDPGDAASIVFQDFVRRSELNAAMLSASRLAVLYREVLIGPVVREENGQRRIGWRIITPENYEVSTVPGDPTRIAELVYRQSRTGHDGKPEDVLVYWSDSEHWIFDEQFRRHPVTNGDVYNIDGSNPFGQIPFVTLHASHATNRYWHGEESESLRMATLNNGIQMSDLWHALKNSAFKQLALSGELDDLDPNSLLDPSQVLDLGREGTGTVLDFQPNLEQIFNVVQQAVGAVAWMHGIRPQSYRGSQTASSGYQIEVENHELVEEHDELRSLFETYEVRLYDMAQAIGAKYGIVLPPGSVQIEWAHIGPQQNPSEVSTYWQLLVEKDLSTRVRALMNIHGISEEEAKVEIADMAAEKRSLSSLPLADMFAPRQPKTDPENPAPSANPNEDDEENAM